MASSRSPSPQVTEQPSQEAPAAINGNTTTTSSSPTASSNDQENDPREAALDVDAAIALMQLDRPTTPSRQLTAEDYAATPPDQIPVPLYHPPEPRTPLTEVILEQEELRSEPPEERSSDVTAPSSRSRVSIDSGTQVMGIEGPPPGLQVSDVVRQRQRRERVVVRVNDGMSFEGRLALEQSGFTVRELGEAVGRRRRNWGGRR